MATVKFSDEMPKPTSIKGTDRFLISDGVTGEAKAPDFNQAKEYLNITGIEMEPLVGGTTSGTALVVPNGPAGEQRTAEVSSGKWYDFGSGPVEASADRRWKSYWSGTAWSLKDMGELPQQPLSSEVSQADNKALTPKGADDALNGFTKKTANILDPTKVVRGGYRLSDGTVADSDNLIRTLPSALDPGQTKISASGVGSIGGAQCRFVFFNSSGTPLGMSSSLVNVDIPAGALSWGLTVANEAGIALNIPNQPYKGTMMVNYGSAALPYEPFARAVDASKINGIQPPVQTELNALNSRINFLESQDKYEYKFPVGQSIDSLNHLVNSNGDYIEFTARIETLSTNNQLRMFGTPPTNINAFGFYLDVIRLRGNVANEAWTEFTGLPSFGEYHKYKLQVNGSNWDLYVDGILSQSKPKTSGLLITTIGNAYTQTLPFWLKDSVTIKVGSTVSEYKNFKQYNNAIEQISLDNDISTRPNVFVSYNPTGYSGREKLTVYVKRESNGNYVGINLIHQVIGSHGDVYRINEAYEYSYDGENMSIIGSDPTLTNGESEFTTQISGKSGHFGGAHGQELQNLIKIFIDGKERSLSSGFTLIPCGSFFYVTKSNIVDNDTGLTPLMEHYKRTDFGLGGYRTFNRVKGLVNPSLLMQYIYTGIVCIGRSNAAKAVDDYFNSVSLGVTDGKILDGVADSVINFEGNNLSIEVSSRQITPVSLTTMWIQDRMTIGDRKYYKINNSSVSATKPLAFGEVWEVECEVVFK